MKQLFKDIMISVIIAVTVLVILVAFFAFVVRDDKTTRYLIADLLNNNAAGALTVIAVFTVANTICLSVVYISNLEVTKSEERYQAYIKKQEENKEKAKAREEEVKKSQADKPRIRTAKQDVTDNYLEQQMAAVYEQRKNG